MLCLDMKLMSKFRSEKRSYQSPSSSTASSPSSYYPPGATRPMVRHPPLSPQYTGPVGLAGGSLDSMMPKRDRSKSLCVDRLFPLGFSEIRLKVDQNPELRPTPPPKAVFTRRQSTANALSASSDLISRRGVFSRRHYGSVEMLPQGDGEGAESNVRRFRVESGDSNGEREEVLFGSPNTPILENPEYQTRWYFKYFLGKLHQNYVGSAGEKVPVFLSVVLSDANNQCVPQYRAILWKKTGAQKICLSYSSSKPMTVKQILSNFPGMDRLEKGPKEIFTPELQKDLLLLEEQEGSVNFKFGVLFMKAGQTSDDQILSNEAGSKGFDKFLTLLGERVRLRAWDKYRGGLDVKGDMTGRHSYYTIYEGHEIMFHVSTMLPFSKDNKQQVERKRHIGNDIVNIVFLEGDAEDMAVFSPSFIKSQFTHIFALITHSSEDGSYRLHVYSEESVPLFGPSLSGSCIFHNHDEFREFLLVKLINGEKATLNTPTFSQKRERTLDMLIRDLYQEHISDNRGTMLNRRAFSDVLPDPPKSSRRKEEARQVEFVRFGQALKLDTIVKGDAPTSLATTGLFKRTPWEPECYYPDFPHEVVCGDSWGDARLMAATQEGGVYILDEGVAHRQIFHKSVQVKQLNCVEAHGILLLRVDKGRDGKIHVFRLTDFDGDPTSPSFEERIRTKADLKDHKLERTKGCHLYAISRPGGSHLRMVVCVGRKLVVLQWRHSAAWTAWCPGSDTDTVDGFQHLREISVGESPSLITLVDSALAPSAGGTGDNHICVGYKHQWDLVNERTGELTKLHHVDSNKVNLVAAIDIYEDDEAELLLCYNNTCHFQKLTEYCSTEFDFQWNSVPEAIVCAFPYILAFTHDSIEIRLVINGNLVQTMVMPNLSFVTNKSDIFFATTAPEFFSLRQERVRVDRLEKEPSISPPSSPQNNKELADRDTGATRPYRIYRIPFRSLTGTSCERRCPTPTTPLHPPVSGGATHKLKSVGKDTRDPEEDGSSDPKPGLSRAGMHLRVVEQPYGSSRSCSASPTLQLGTPTFPQCSGIPTLGGNHTPSTGLLGAGGSVTASPTKTKPAYSGRLVGLGPKNSPLKIPGRNRNRTNSLTVEMNTAAHIKHLKNHLPLHHEVRHPPLQHHPTLK